MKKVNLTLHLVVDVPTKRFHKLSDLSEIISPKVIDKSVRIFRTYGCVMPVFDDQKFNVLGGWATISAAKILGFDTLAALMFDNPTIDDLRFHADSLSGFGTVRGMESDDLAEASRFVIHNMRDELKENLRRIESGEITGLAYSPIGISSLGRAK